MRWRNRTLHQLLKYLRFRKIISLLMIRLLILKVHQQPTQRKGTSSEHRWLRMIQMMSRHHLLRIQLSALYMAIRVCPTKERIHLGLRCMVVMSLRPMSNIVIIIWIVNLLISLHQTTKLHQKKNQMRKMVSNK